MKTLLSLILLLILMVIPATISACTCGGNLYRSTEKNVLRARDRATVVFSGQVVKITPLSDENSLKFNIVSVELKPEKIWKGEKVKTITVETTLACCLCGFHFEMGESYLLYLKEVQGKYDATICTRNKKLKEATEDIKYLKKNCCPTH